MISHTRWKRLKLYSCFMRSCLAKLRQPAAMSSRIYDRVAPIIAFACLFFEIYGLPHESDPNWLRHDFAPVRFEFTVGPTLALSHAKYKIKTRFPDNFKILQMVQACPYRQFRLARMNTDGFVGTPAITADWYSLWFPGFAHDVFE